MTAQESVVLSENSHIFTMTGSAPFTVSAASSTDDDYLQSVTLQGCSSQWSLWLDPQQPFPVRICGGSVAMAVPGSGSMTLCPHSYTFYANFQANQPGTSSCNVAIVTMSASGSGSGSATTYLMLSGSGSSTDGISVDKPTISFGDVPVATTTTPTQLKVQNLGSGAVVVTGSLSGTGFGVTGNVNYQSFTLAGLGQETFDVTCTPPALGPLSGTLTFTSGTSAPSVSLSCKGISSTVMVAPRPINFDPTLVGRPPPAQTVTITGPATTTIDMVALDAAATAAGVTITSNPQGMQIGAGKTLTLDYSAAEVHAPGPLGVVTIKVSTDASAFDVAISGTALLGGVGTNPAGIEFGAVCAGSKAMKDVEVYASEAGDVIVQSLTPPAAPFTAMAVDTLPKALAGGHSGPSVTVRASFMPAAPGDFSDQLALSSNVPNMGSTQVPVHGIGLAEGIAATPNVVHFGTAPVGSTTSIKEVQFTNCGTKDLMFTGATITGDNADEFTLIGTNASRAIKPTESEVFMVVMQPEASGDKTAQLVISHDGGTTVADLDGTGEGGANKERETYYACSTGRGGGAGAWPIAVALLMLRRRRRA